MPHPFLSTQVSESSWKIGLFFCRKHTVVIADLIGEDKPVGFMLLKVNAAPAPTGCAVLSILMCTAAGVDWILMERHALDGTENEATNVK